MRNTHIALIKNKRHFSWSFCIIPWTGPYGDQDSDHTLQIVGVIGSNTCATDINKYLLPLHFLDVHVITYQCVYFMIGSIPSWNTLWVKIKDSLTIIITLTCQVV